METRPTPCLPCKKILIVDDNVDCRMLQTIVITRMGFEVIEADNGASAINQALEAHPDLILMDLGMPIMNGEDAIVQLKIHPSTRDIPVIICTAFGRGPRVDRARDAGAVEILHKPFDFSELQKLLQKHLSNELKARVVRAVNVGVEQQ